MQTTISFVSQSSNCILKVVKTAWDVTEGSVSKFTTAWQSAGSPLSTSSLTGTMFAAGKAENHPSPSMDVKTCCLTLERGVMPAGVDCTKARADLPTILIVRSRCSGNIERTRIAIDQEGFRGKSSRPGFGER